MTYISRLVQQIFLGICVLFLPCCGDAASRREPLNVVLFSAGMHAWSSGRAQGTLSSLLMTTAQPLCVYVFINASDAHGYIAYFEKVLRLPPDSASSNEMYESVLMNRFIWTGGNRACTMFYLLDVEVPLAYSLSHIKPRYRINHYAGYIGLCKLFPYLLVPPHTKEVLVVDDDMVFTQSPADLIDPHTGEFMFEKPRVGYGGNRVLGAFNGTGVYVKSVCYEDQGRRDYYTLGLEKSMFTREFVMAGFVVHAVHRILSDGWHEKVLLPLLEYFGSHAQLAVRSDMEINGFLAGQYPDQFGCFSCSWNCYYTQGSLDVSCPKRCKVFHLNFNHGLSVEGTRERKLAWAARQSDAAVLPDDMPWEMNDLFQSALRFPPHMLYESCRLDEELNWLLIRGTSLENSALLEASGRLKDDMRVLLSTGSTSEVTATALREIFWGKTGGLVVELGGGDGGSSSSSHGLSAVGWRRVIVEPNPDWWKAAEDLSVSELEKTRDSYVAAGICASDESVLHYIGSHAVGKGSGWVAEFLTEDLLKILAPGIWGRATFAGEYNLRHVNWTEVSADLGESIHIKEVPCLRLSEITSKLKIRHINLLIVEFDAWNSGALFGLEDGKMSVDVIAARLNPENVGAVNAFLHPKGYINVGRGSETRHWFVHKSVEMTQISQDPKSESVSRVDMIHESKGRDL